MKLKKTIEQLRIIIEKYRNVTNIEIEARLGFFSDVLKKFDTNITEFFYNKIKKDLDTYTKWDKKTTQQSTDYFYNNIRFTETNGSVSCIKKEKITQLDFTIENTPYDLRVVAVLEHPVENALLNKKKSSFIRKKYRTSYLYNCWSFDLTKSEISRNNCSAISYELEIELIPALINKYQSSEYLSHSLILKILDLINISEPLENTANIVLRKT